MWRRPYEFVQLGLSLSFVRSDDRYRMRWDGTKAEASVQGFYGDIPFARGQASLGVGRKFGPPVRAAAGRGELHYEPEFGRPCLDRRLLGCARRAGDPRPSLRRVSCTTERHGYGSSRSRSRPGARARSARLCGSHGGASTTELQSCSVCWRAEFFFTWALQLRMLSSSARWHSRADCRDVSVSCRPGNTL